MAFKQLGPLIQLSQQVAEQQKLAQENPQAAQGQKGGNLAGMGQVIPFLMQLMGAGGGSSALGDELTKKVIDAGLEQMFAGTALLKAMQTKMLADMGAKAIKDSFEKKE